VDLVKSQGVLAEIIKRYPNVDLVEFLQDELQLSPSKAENLAQKIEKKYLQKPSEAKKSLRKILENPAFGESPPEGTYAVDCLSDIEFKNFLRWLLEALGYKVRLDKGTIGWGIDLVVEKEDETIAVVARKYPKNIRVSGDVLLVSEKARQTYECKRSIIAMTARLTADAKEEAERLGVDIWDRDILAKKIADVHRKDTVESPLAFPEFGDSLLTSLLRLEESKDFIIERRVNGKFDLFLAGVKFPLLTFQSEGARVMRCVFRMKNYQPIGEAEAQALIWTDENNNTLGPNDMEAYDAVTRYLKDFIE
jgi:hypothetical protein